MNKNILSVAVATALVAPPFTAPAAADVTISGRVQAEYNVENRDCVNKGYFVDHGRWDGNTDATVTAVSGSGCDDSMQSVDDDAGQSRLLIDASEKLGNGLTAFARVALAFDGADGSSIAQRDTKVGIKGSWGSISVGSHDAPYKTAGGVKWDPWTATHLQARRAGGMSGGGGVGGHNGFMRNSIYYASPNINGFSLQFAISPDETNSGAGNEIDGDNDWSVALQYKNGPWHAILAHNNNNDDYDNTWWEDEWGPGSTKVTEGEGDETLTKVGLRWSSGNHTLAGQFEWINNAGATGGMTSGSAPGSRTGDGGSGYSHILTGEDGYIYWLNYQFKYGNNIFSASYGHTESDSKKIGPDRGGYAYGGKLDLESDYYALGVIHKFSKQTRIFAGYSWTDASGFGSTKLGVASDGVTLSAGGNDVSAGDGKHGTVAGSAGNVLFSLADRSVWTIGIRKDF